MFGKRKNISAMNKMIPKTHYFLPPPQPLEHVNYTQIPCVVK